MLRIFNDGWIETETDQFYSFDSPEKAKRVLANAFNRIVEQIEDACEYSQNTTKIEDVIDFETLFKSIREYHDGNIEIYDIIIKGKDYENKIER